MNKSIGSFTTSHLNVVGEDHYHIATHFNLNLLTGEVTAKCSIVKNFFRSTNETIFEGPGDECLEYLKNVESPIIQQVVKTPFGDQSIPDSFKIS